MYSNTNLLPYIRNYTEADNHFIDTRKPPRSKKWDENERPLKNVSAYHYRLIRHRGGEFYDVVLYNTTMARFYKPTAEGHERRLYMGHYSQTSKSFMHTVLHVGPITYMAVQPIEQPYYRWAEQDKKVSVFIGEGKRIGDDMGMDYSADLWFDANDLLLVDKSRALDAHRLVSTAEDKARRKELRQLMEGYAMLMAMRLPEFLNENTILSSRDTIAFNKINSDDYGLREFVNAVKRGEQPTERHIEALVQYTDNAVSALASRRAADFTNLRWVGTCLKEFPQLDIDDLQISEKDVIKTVTSKLLRVSGAEAPTGRVPYPSFRPAVDLPRSNLFV